MELIICDTDLFCFEGGFLT